MTKINLREVTGKCRICHTSIYTQEELEEQICSSCSFQDGLDEDVITDAQAEEAIQAYYEIELHEAHMCGGPERCLYCKKGTSRG